MNFGVLMIESLFFILKSARRGALVQGRYNSNNGNDNHDKAKESSTSASM
jgi:hypothetical protein